MQMNKWVIGGVSHSGVEKTEARSLEYRSPAWPSSLQQGYASRGRRPSVWDLEKPSLDAGKMGVTGGSANNYNRPLRNTVSKWLFYIIYHILK